MDKRTIIRYFNKQLTKDEAAQLFSWVEASDYNRRYFNVLKNLWTASTLSVSPDANPDFNDLKARITLAATKPKRSSIAMRYLVRAAAILMIPLAVSVSWLLYERASTLPLAQTDNPTIRIYTPFCAKAELVLPDSTRVWLNSGSSLSYPRRFEGSKREVELEGEAYFDVRENKSHPFVIHTPHKMAINVTGTSFNVRAYAEDEDVEMTLVEGTINLCPEGSKEVRMEPKQSVRYLEKENTLYLKSDVNTDLYTSWKDGVLSFDNASMEDLVKRLERWYGVDIHIDDKRVLEQRYSGKFKEETINQVLELIRQTSNISYRIEEKDVFLFTKQ